MVNNEHYKQILYVVWDIWSFRNSLVHGKGRVNDKAIHKELNFRTRQQFTINFRDLIPCDRCTYQRSSISSLIDFPKGNETKMVSKSERNKIVSEFRRGN